MRSVTFALEGGESCIIELLVDGSVIIKNNFHESCKSDNHDSISKDATVIPLQKCETFKCRSYICAR